MTATALPAGACDTHVHVFRPDLYPYADDRAYTPGRIATADLAAFLDGHGLERVVIVQPSVYGTDNRALLDALRELGGRARAIAVVDCATVTDRELADLQSAGCTGVRLNLATREMAGLADVACQAAKRLAGSPFAIQIYAPLADIVTAAPAILDLDRPVILDHYGGARLNSAGLPRGTDVLVDLARNGPAYIKISAAHRVSRSGEAGWQDVAPIARHLFAEVPGRLIWGSDWPHTGGAGRSGRPRDEIEPFEAIDDHLALEKLAEWCDDPDLFRRILVATPAALFGFAA